MEGLKEFRQSKNLSIQEMADLLGITSSHYYKIEEGHKYPSFKVLILFKKNFKDVSIDKIFFR